MLLCALEFAPGRHLPPYLSQSTRFPDSTAVQTLRAASLVTVLGALLSRLLPFVTLGNYKGLAGQALGLFFPVCFAQGNEVWLEVLVPLVKRLHLPDPPSAGDVSTLVPAGKHQVRGSQAFFFSQLIATCGFLSDHSTCFPNASQPGKSDGIYDMPPNRIYFKLYLYIFFYNDSEMFPSRSW